MGKVKYYRLTEWKLVKRNLLIGLLVLGLIGSLWLIINIEVAWCPGKIDCSTAPGHSIRNLL